MSTTSGHQLPAKVVSALIRPGPAVDAANRFSKDIPAAYPRTFVVYAGGYAGGLAVILIYCIFKNM